MSILATDFLVRGNLEPDQLPEHLREPLPKPTNVVVIGGGDTSMDCVRASIRMGAESVTCVYRRTEAEMLGRAEERKNAREEGVRFDMLTLPTRLIGDDEGNVTAVECQRMELGEPDDSGRRRPCRSRAASSSCPRIPLLSPSAMGPTPSFPRPRRG
ncbi:MAG: FAD-dependent oxidoreductase [Dehalococcoidia bacterium]|nr:FAD-dependent oxidoreductase [Dehalococcoidia bacterium]